MAGTYYGCLSVLQLTPESHKLVLISTKLTKIDTSFTLNWYYHPEKSFTYTVGVFYGG